MKNTTSMKKKLMAVYDRLFCRFGPQGWWPGKTKTEIIVGAILTQNTNWGNVEKALRYLKKAKLLNFKGLNDCDVHELAQLIRPSGYYNMKAVKLKNFARFFLNDYHGSWKRLADEDLKQLRIDVLAVNGVGPETADSILLYALNRPLFVVDAYTKRIFFRMGFIAHDADYHDVQNLFMTHLSCDVPLFNEYHAVIVRLAKVHCRTRPQCEGCPLLSLCPQRGVNT